MRFGIIRSTGLFLTTPKRPFYTCIGFRMSFITILLVISSVKSKPLPSKKIWWWGVFSITGFVLPSVCYTICSYLTGYRIAISIQTFIPLCILCLKHQWPNEAQCRSLIFAFMGTICLWWYTPWMNELTDLWKIWFSIIAAFVQVFFSIYMV